MKAILPVTVVFTLLLARGAACAQDGSYPADLAAMPRCVWATLTSQDKAPLLTAVEARDKTATKRAAETLKGGAQQVAAACSPGFRHDAETGDEVLSYGLRQEAAGDLVTRDLKLKRAQLDRAIARAPEGLADSLSRMAEDALDFIDPDVLPPLTPIYAALGLPPGGPQSPREAAWLTDYVLGYFEVRAAAGSYTP